MENREIYCRMHNMSAERVTVSIPQFGCEEYIQRAVSSILTQTYNNLLVVVVNDGDDNFHWESLSQISDPRLVRFNLSSNQGRYFADQVVLEATTDKYLLIQDADDWSEPERVEKLLDQIKKDSSNGAVSIIRMHATSDYPIPISYKDWYPERNEPPGEKFINRLGHYGLFEIKSLKDIGGYFGGFRISNDRLIMNLLLMTGRISFVEGPLYNYCRRHGSLTLDSSTDMYSSARQEAIAKLQGIYDNILPSYLDYSAHKIEKGDFLTAIRQCVREYLTKESQDELDHETAKLKQMLQDF